MVATATALSHCKARNINLTAICPATTMECRAELVRVRRLISRLESREQCLLDAIEELAPCERLDRIGEGK